MRSGFIIWLCPLILAAGCIETVELGGLSGFGDDDVALGDSDPGDLCARANIDPTTGTVDDCATALACCLQLAADGDSDNDCCPRGDEVSCTLTYSGDQMLVCRPPCVCDPPCGVDFFCYPVDCECRPEAP